MLPFHFESQVSVPTSVEQLFAFLDDHTRLSGHMTQSSWMMAGSKMTIEMDAAKGQVEGSHIRLSGRILGLRLFVEEVVTKRRAPSHKEWETIGTPRLLIIGSYRMGFDIEQRESESALTIFIDYEIASTKLGRWLPFLSRWYARWCTDQMAADAVAYSRSTDSNAKQGNNRLGISHQH